MVNRGAMGTADHGDAATGKDACGRPAADMALGRAPMKMDGWDGDWCGHRLT